MPPSPVFFLLKYYNPLLRSELLNFINVDQEWFFFKSWVYGPVHNLWLLPLVFSVHSVALIFRCLLIFYVLLTFLVSLLLCKALIKNKDLLFFVAFFTIILGSFSILENFAQRNVELLEFSLIIVAYLCLRKNRDFMAGVFLCLAAMAKLLPIIFFPYLLVKRRSRAAIGFITALLVIIALTQLTLGWQNWAMLDAKVMREGGVALELDQFLGKTYFTPISQARGSFYTFILSFFAKIDMSSYIPKVTYNNFLIPNWIYIIFSLIFIITTFLLFYVTGRRGNLFYEFAIVLLLMLLISHHTNPHYYIFTLLAFMSILKFYTYDMSSHKLSYPVRLLLFLSFVFSLLATGHLIPFSLYQRILHLKNSAFHYFSTYGIFGIATFILWWVVIWIYWLDYTKNGPD